jgi:hypothetical protein
MICRLIIIITFTQDLDVIFYSQRTIIVLHLSVDAPLQEVVLLRPLLGLSFLYLKMLVLVRI